MSPVPSAISEKSSVRPVPVQPFPVPESFLSLAREIVVDWQMPNDPERPS